MRGPSTEACRCCWVLLLSCSISEDRGYLSIRSGMWAGYELSVTRALGHKHLAQYGVLCEPTVRTLTLQPNDVCLVSMRPSSMGAACWVAWVFMMIRTRAMSMLVAPHAFCSLVVTVTSSVPVCCFVHAQILASDGVWDVMDPREAANRVMDVISAGGSAEEAAQQLVRDTVMLAECSPGGDADNTTALVVVF